MTQMPTDQPPTDGPARRNSILLLGVTIADTTWRMFIPTIGLTILGLFVDKQLGTVPIFLIVGIITGTAVASWLIWDQLKRVKQK